MQVVGARRSEVAGAKVTIDHAEGEADAVAIGPWLGIRLGGEDRDFSRHRHSAATYSAAFQGFAQNGLLEEQLGGVIRVLVVAAAADAEVRAERLDALWAREG